MESNRYKLNPAKVNYEKNGVFWLPLDNAAKIYPAIRTKEHTTVLRLTAVLKERVAIKYLLIAIAIAEERFPYYKVKLQKGFFWYYLEQIDQNIVPEVDDGIPCMSFSNRDKKNKLLFRILVYKNRISVEFSHILTDGYGALMFLTQLLFFYFREKGIIADNLIGDHIDNEEFEDAYNRYFKENIPSIVNQAKAFHLPFKLNNRPRFDVLIAIISIIDIKNKAHEKGVSITDYLVAVYLYILQDIFNNIRKQKIYIKNKILRIQVPINLRKKYPSKTMRNFSLFVMPEIDLRLGHYTFDEIVKIVYHKMQLETDEKLVNKIISRNVGSEKKILVRGMPLFIKSLILSFKFYTEGVNQYSGVLTNMGKINLPEPVSDRIKYFILTPPPPNKKLKINCGVIGFCDKLVLSFGNITVSKELEQMFIRFLIKEGIKVKITKS